MTDYFLKVDGLYAGYGRAQVLEGLSVYAQAGQVVTVVGPNGAGKSTMLNAIMGGLPSKGQIQLAGQDISHLTLSERVELGLALVPETRALFSSMPVEENLVLGSWRLKNQRHASQRREEKLAYVYELFPRLKERRQQLAGTLSGGERQMLAVGRALMGEPKVLMLDEPSLGLAPLVVEEIFSIIYNLRLDGVAILLVEQNARAALALADYGYVLEMGAVTLQGDARELEQDARVIETYLGAGKHKE